MNVREWAKSMRVHPHTLYLLMKGKKFASLPLAVELEKVSGGRVKVEQVVRPEVVEALREYLRLRASPGEKERQEP